MGHNDMRLAIRDTVDSAANEFTGKIVVGLVETIRGLFKLLSQGLVSLIVTFMVGAFFMLDFREIKKFFWSHFCGSILRSGLKGLVVVSITKSAHPKATPLF